MVPGEKNPRPAGTIWMLNLDEPRPAVAPRINAAFRRAGPESVPLLAAASGAGGSTEIRRRFDSGRRCYTAWVGDALACYGWVSLERECVGELNLRLRLLPGEAYIWDCFTLPAFRRKHLYTALLVYIAGQLQEDNLCRVWIGADSENVASQHGIALAGFHSVADLFEERVSARRLVWSQAKPGVPQNLVAEARRVFLYNREKVWLPASSGG